MPVGEFEAFESTESAMDQVNKALKDERINIIGVYGMGGVGKTTLVEHIEKQAKSSETLYDKVVKVTMSQNQDLKRIQGELAEKLGIPLAEENVEVRASWLLDRLKQEKILLILDYLWDRLDLALTGIPCGGDVKTGELQSLAREVAQECKDLPLALITVARAHMFGKMHC
ncbi:putative disease resistance protein At4g14610 [Tasmannia lanceolata]|uniref:putative disease resistance protein At4g14610 n=1 Tax=Tasmannia lanceolata TaxID=3420 RepID=UPI004062951F